MSGLLGFLLARVAEDEEAARAGERADMEFPSGYVDTFGARTSDGDLAAFVRQFTPARVLAQCEATRRIVEAYQQTQTSEFVAEVGYQVAGGAVHAYRAVLHALALPHVSHPDFDPAWLT